MIEYQHLCQAISDWREGKRPEAPLPAQGISAVEELDAAMVTEESGYEQEEGYEEIVPYEEAASNTQPQQIPPTGDYEPAPEYEPPVEYAEQPAGEFEGEGIDRTAAYVPGEYDPAGVNEQQPEYQAEAGGYEEPQAEQPVYAEGEYEQPQYEQAEAVAEYVEPAADYVEPVAEALEVNDDLDVDVDDDDDDDDDDDFERDYDLEEIDDQASFDFANDLRAFFVAELRVQNAWEDKAQRTALLHEYGVRDETHYYQVLATFERYVVSDEAEEKYGGIDGVMQLKLDVTQDMTYQQQQERMEGELSSEFEPVEGISLQAWAQAQAAIASGGAPEDQLPNLGIDQPTWDRVSAEWNARMSRDATATIATEYGKAFSGAGQGQYGAAAADGAQAMQAGGDVEGDPPIPFEQWVEITVAQSAASEQGKDAAEVLASFGMTPADWGAVGAWWGTYFNRHVMDNNQELFHRYNQLQEHYEAQYGVADADDDIDY